MRSAQKLDPTPAMDDNATISGSASETRLRARAPGGNQAVAVDAELGTALTDALEDILRFERRTA